MDGPSHIKIFAIKFFLFCFLKTTLSKGYSAWNLKKLNKSFSVLNHKPKVVIGAFFLHNSYSIAKH